MRKPPDEKFSINDLRRLASHIYQATDCEDCELEVFERRGNQVFRFVAKPSGWTTEVTLKLRRK
jgi:hypothetical protein